MQKKLISLVALGSLFTLPFTSAKAAAPWPVTIQTIECRADLTLAPVNSNQTSICFGYDKSRLPKDQPLPVEVSRYLAFTVTIDPPRKVSVATVYVSPASGTIPDWTPAVTQTYDPNAPAASSISVYNAYSNAFPLVTKKCSYNTDSGINTRGFMVYVEIIDENGVQYDSNRLGVRIDKQGIVNPPVNDGTGICPHYPPNLP